MCAARYSPLALVGALLPAHPHAAGVAWRDATSMLAPPARSRSLARWVIALRHDALDVLVLAYSHACRRLPQHHHRCPTTAALPLLPASLPACARALMYQVKGRLARLYRAFPSSFFAEFTRFDLKCGRRVFTSGVAYIQCATGLISEVVRIANEINLRGFKSAGYNTRYVVRKVWWCLTAGELRRSLSFPTPTLPLSTNKCRCARCSCRSLAPRTNSASSGRACPCRPYGGCLRTRAATSGGARAKGVPRRWICWRCTSGLARRI